MNRECHGTYYSGINKYRCLGNGQFCDGPVPDKCPICNRPIASTTVSNVKLRTTIIEEIEWEDNRFVELWRFTGPIREIKDA
jgi:hypothetical protein